MSYIIMIILHNSRSRLWIHVSCYKVCRQLQFCVLQSSYSHLHGYLFVWAVTLKSEVLKDK